MSTTQRRLHLLTELQKLVDHSIGGPAVLGWVGRMLGVDLSGRRCRVQAEHILRTDLQYLLGQGWIKVAGELAHQTIEIRRISLTPAGECDGIPRLEEQVASEMEAATRQRLRAAHADYRRSTRSTAHSLA